ncbi:MAG: hypothetical protein ABIP75_03145 [Pyrinomonadaceae bacterium]
MLTPAKIVIISATVMGIVQLLKAANLPAKLAPVAVVVISAICLILFGWSQNDLSRASSFDYFATGITIALSAMGLFGLAQKGIEVSQPLLNSNAAKMLLIFGVASVLLLTQTACPGKAKVSIQAAAEASKDLGGGTRDVIKAVRQAYEKNLISLELKNKLADGLGLIATGGLHGTQVIDALNNEFGGDINRVPSEVWTNAAKLFDDEVVRPFLDLLRDLNTITPGQSLSIRIALSAVRSAILTIAVVFGRQNSLDRQFKQFEGGQVLALARLEVRFG